MAGEKAINGTTVTAVSGSSHSTLPASTGAVESLAGQAKPTPTLLKLKPTRADKQGVANALERHGQLIHPTVQPLPSQVGGGTFSENKKWGKLRDDLKALRSAGK